ncbi:glycosidase [Pseudomonas sp. W2I6]|nr:glycosidase [Pseudomonas sp. W2I6]
MQNWQHSVIYQIYPKSFHSHAGNATGDLLGIVDKLDYLKWLGVDCLWITPVPAFAPARQRLRHQ